MMQSCPSFFARQLSVSLACLIALIIFAPRTARGEAFQVFTDRASWEDALAGLCIQTESFNDFSGFTTPYAFDRVEFDVVDPFNTVFYADNVSFATVPEPASLSLCLAAFGLGAMCRLGRRR